MAKKTYKIVGLECASCASLIELDLEDAGIQSVCTYATETLVVELDGENVTEKKIVEIVKKAGYTLQV